MVSFTTTRRKNKEGKPCIAPFINGHNVWDIPESLWATPVREAVAHAYRIGYEQALRDVAKLHRNAPWIGMEEPWKETWEEESGT